MGMKMKARPDDLQHSPYGDGGVGGVEIEAGEVVDADGGWRGSRGRP